MTANVNTTTSVSNEEYITVASNSNGFWTVSVSVVSME